MRYHVEHRGFLELYLTFATETSDATHPAHEYMRGRYARTIAQIRRRIGEAVALGQVPPMDDATLDYESACFLAILDGLEIQWIHNPSLDLPALVGEYVEQSIARWRGGTRRGRAGLGELGLRWATCAAAIPSAGRGSSGSSGSRASASAPPPTSSTS